MNRRISLAPFALLLALSACAAYEDVGESRAAIAGGMESDNESVVFVFDASRGGACSGTLVGPQAVLTMRYCAVDGGTGDPLSPLMNLQVGSGARIRESTAMARVTSVAETGVGTRGAAIILHLDSPMPGTPVELSDVVPAVDDEVTLLGFGQTESGASGTRMEGTAIVTAVPDGEDFFSTEGPAFHCQGDAGGPVLDASGRLVGMGYFITEACGEGVASYRRMDDLVAFVEDNATPPAVDAGSDTGADDAALTDTGTTGDGATGDTGTTMEPGGGGCDCFAASTSEPNLPAALPLAFVALFLGARRLRRQ